MSETLIMTQGKLVGVQTSIFTIFNQAKYDPQAIPTAWKEFFAKAGNTELVKTDTFYGASIPSMSFDAPMDYFAGAIVSQDFEVPEGLSSVDIPEGEYFTVTHTGPIMELAGSYQKAYGVALPESGKEMRPAPHLEIYNSQLNPMDVAYEMVIAIPVA